MTWANLVIYNYYIFSRTHNQRGEYTEGKSSNGFCTKNITGQAQNTSHSLFCKLNEILALCLFVHPDKLLIKRFIWGKCENLLAAGLS